MKNNTEQTGRGNPYKLALGLLEHPDRQLSGAPHRERSMEKYEKAPDALFQ